jgi:hypothetical protein
MTAQREGFFVEQFGEASDGAPLIVAWRSPERPVLSVLVSAGIHGDEPAGPLALLQWIAMGVPDPGVAWTVFPLLNPTGWDSGTRECAAGVDLNRNYFDLSQPETRAQVEWLERHKLRCDWAVCLHEDWEAKGFYLYEVGEPGAASIGRAILRQVEPVIAVETAPEIDGMPARHGLIRPSGDLSALGTVWPEALRLIRNHAPLCHTFETPSAAPLGKRMSAHISGLRAGLSEMLRPVIEDDFVI